MKMLKEKRVVSFIKKHIVFMFLVITAFLIRAIWVTIVAFNESFPLEPDTVGYIKNAESILNNGHLIYDGFRTPGYPMIIAVFMVLSKSHYYLYVCVFQNLLNLISLCAVYQIAFILTKSFKPSLIGLSVASLNFHDIYYNNALLTDSLAQSLTCISLLFFLLCIRKIQSDCKVAGCIAIGAITLSFALLIRPSLLFLPLAYIIGLVFIEVCVKNYSVIVSTILIISVICYIPVCAWTIRNKRVADYPGYSTVSSINLYCFNSAAVYAKQNNMQYNDAVDYLKSGNDVEYQKYLQKMNKYDAMDLRAKEIIVSDIPTYLKRCVVDCAFLEFYPGVLSFHSVRDSLDKEIEKIKKAGFDVLLDFNYSRKLFYIIVICVDFIILLMLFVFSFVGAIRLLQKNWITAILLIGTLCYHIVVCCQPVGYGAYSRFRLSFSMISIILAACAFDKRSSNKSQKCKGRVSECIIY